MEWGRLSADNLTTGPLGNYLPMIWSARLQRAAFRSIVCNKAVCRLNPINTLPGLILQIINLRKIKIHVLNHIYKYQRTTIFYMEFHHLKCQILAVKFLNILPESVTVTNPGVE